MTFSLTTLGMYVSARIHLREDAMQAKGPKYMACVVCLYSAVLICFTPYLQTNQRPYIVAKPYMSNLVSW